MHNRLSFFSSLFFQSFYSNSDFFYLTVYQLKADHPYTELLIDSSVSNTPIEKVIKTSAEN